MIIRKGIDKVVGRYSSRFFMPGHNGDKNISLHYDVTEIEGTDNLHSPSGIIKLAQLNASVAFGALHTFFLVNGSSAGLHASVMAVCKRGDTLIVDRGCHISVINALVMNDIKPVFIYPEFNSEFGINSYVSPSEVQLAFEKHPEAKGVLITSPNYYGVCSDIAAIAEITRKSGGVLIVDEAHGAHFCFGEDMPKSAIYCGADIAVQSLHKTLPCITQGAVLHLGSTKISPEIIGENLKLLQTTSPSYLIMMTMDEAIHTMQKDGRSLLAKTVKHCNELRCQLDASGKFKCLKNDDPTRLVIKAGKNAEMVQNRLAKLNNIFIEMCDGSNLVLIAKAVSREADFMRLKSALGNISLLLPPLEEADFSPPPKTQLVLTPTEAYYSKTIDLPPENAVGRIAARALYKTPPCMSIIAPGEAVTREIAEIAQGSITVVET